MVLESDVAFLEHYGVKGMQWGVRKAQSISSNRQRNKESKARENTTGNHQRARINASKNLITTGAKFKSDPSSAERSARDKKIVDARERISSGQTKLDYKLAKNKYKADVHRVGRYEARQILATAKTKKMVDIHNANQVRDGKEAVTTLIGAVGSIALSAALKPK